MPTRETRFISFNLGAARIEATEDIFRRAGLEGSSGFHRDGILAGYFSVELPVDDPCLTALIRGGFRLPVVSQRVRSLFKKLKVRQVSFDPVFTLDSSGLVPW